MTESTQADPAARLKQLEEELAQLTGLLPEHCVGREEYIDVHRASVEHWQKIEALEDEIATLKSALAST